jgi:tryptophan-rich sensory protein
MHAALAIVIAITSVLATSLGGQYFTSRSVKSSWYDCIKPKITPPSIVFPIVWTTLYLLIAIAFARILIAGNAITIGLFAVNLTLNVIWCYLFFARKQPWAAVYAILALWVTILLIQWHSRSDRIVVALLFPYLLWVTFATLLNILSAINAKKKCAN